MEGGLEYIQVDLSHTDSIPFLWGVATSSHQVEGKNYASDWWLFENFGSIEDKSISSHAVDHRRFYKEDIQLIKNLSLNAYRFSIEWAKIEPIQGVFNEEELDWYCELVECCLQNNIQPMVTLHHFTNPLWFYEMGGFINEQAPILFLKYVSKVLGRLGSKVKLWCTFNEPMAWVIGQYLGCYMPPACLASDLLGVASYHILKAHVKTYDLIHQTLKNVWVGIAHNMIDFVPLNPFNPIHSVMAKRVSSFYNQSWLDAISGRKQHFGLKGVLKLPPTFFEALNRKTSDFIGLNYYTKIYVGLTKKFQIEFSQPKDKTSELGWAIHPQGLSRMLNLASQYELPIFITENGIADSQDKHRPEFLLEHLVEIALAIEKKIPVRGYFHWSLMDNFEWIKGFEPRFGLYAIDYGSLTRTPRDSALLYKSIIEQHESFGHALPKKHLLELLLKALLQQKENKSERREELYRTDFQS